MKKLLPLLVILFLLSCSDRSTETSITGNSKTVETYRALYFTQDKQTGGKEPVLLRTYRRKNSHGRKVCRSPDQGRIHSDFGGVNGVEVVLII